MSVAKPNTTQTPNILFDELLPIMKEAELRVTLAIVRKTFGWHKDEDELSLSQLMKLTGMGRQGVLNGVEAGMKRGTISRRPAGQSFLYSMVVNEVDQSTKETGTSPRSRPELVHEVDTQKKLKETKETVKTGAPTAAQLRKHPAIQAYRDKAHLYPPETWLQRIIDAVGDTPEKVEAFGKLVDSWVGHGYNKQNIEGMLEAFKAGGIKSNGHKSQRGTARIDVEGESDAAIEWLRRKQAAERGETA